MPPKVKSQKSKVKKVKSTAEGPHTFSLLLEVNIFSTCTHGAPI